MASFQETREIVGQNTLEITEHEESPTLGIHAYRLKVHKVTIMYCVINLN